MWQKQEKSKGESVLKRAWKKNFASIRNTQLEEYRVFARVLRIAASMEEEYCKYSSPRGQEETGTHTYRDTYIQGQIYIYRDTCIQDTYIQVECITVIDRLQMCAHGRPWVAAGQSDDHYY